MSSNITIAPVIVNPQGATTAERRLSIVNTTQSQSTLFALATEKGKLGAAVRVRLATGGAVGIAQQAASGNYRPLAEYLSAKTGDVVIISGRAGFESLGDVFHAKVLTAQKAKDGGCKMGKDGVMVPGPKLALANEMLKVVQDCIAFAEEYHAARLAEKAKAEESEKAKAEESEKANEQPALSQE